MISKEINQTINKAITKEGIRSFLEKEYEDLPVLVYQQIDSTNDEAKRRLQNGEKKNLLIVAEEQTNGHGRRGRNFYSPKSTGIYMSLLLHLKAKFEDSLSITTAASVIVSCVIERLLDIKPQIKWVNDVYLDGKKICGILTEAIFDSNKEQTMSVIVGIGINVSTVSFPENIQNTAACIGNTNGISRDCFIAEIAKGILNFSKDVTDSSYIKDYRRLSMVIGKEITYNEKEQILSAKVIDIDEHGGLEIINELGEEMVLRTGEISIRLK